MINFGGGEYKSGCLHYQISLVPPTGGTDMCFLVKYTVHYSSGFSVGPHFIGTEGVHSTLADAVDAVHRLMWPSEEEFIVWPPQLTEKGVSE